MNGNPKTAIPNCQKCGIESFSIGLIPIAGLTGKVHKTKVIFCTKCGAVFEFLSLREIESDPVPDDVFID
jgi:ribosomal protein L37E